MGIRYVQNTKEAREVARALEATGSVALDCEAAGFHRYSDRLCLIQLTAPEDTFLLDPLAFDPTDVLGPVLGSPEREVVMHGADFDVRLLDRDLGLRIRGLFDTQIAASLLGIPAPGLSNLLGRFLGIDLSKKYQRADWAERPLSGEMLRYAADDTRYLVELREMLAEELAAKGRMSWAQEEFRAQEEIRFEEPEDEDPVVRVRHARGLPVRDVALLREALMWRDRVARSRDRAPFRVAADDVLVRVVEEKPDSVDALSQVRGFSPALARSSGEELLRSLAEISGRPEEALVPYPAPRANGGRRLDPDEEERMRRLKDIRNRIAEELDLERGVLLPNHLLRAIAVEAPASADELRTLPGIRGWQVEVLGEPLLAGI